MKILPAADLHIDSPLRGLSAVDGALAEEVRSATRRAFVNLVNLALAESVDVLLLAGDIYDGDWRDHQTGVFFASELKRLETQGVRVFIARGNHDAESQISRHVTLPQNVTVFGSDAVETVHLPALGLAVHGWSFDRQAVNENVARRFPPPVPGAINVAVLHTNLDGQVGHGNYAPCSTDDLRTRGYDYWALGHVHSRRHEQFGSTHVVYPGNLQGRHAREVSPEGKGATLVTTDGASITRVEHRVLDVVRWLACEVDIAGLSSRDDIVRKIAERVTTAVRATGRAGVARVTVTGATPLHREWAMHEREIAAGLGAHLGQGAYVEKIVRSTRDVEEAAGVDDTFASIAGVVARAKSERDLRQQLCDTIGNRLGHILGAHGARALADAGLRLPTSDDPDGVEALLQAATQRLAARIRPSRPTPRS